MSHILADLPLFGQISIFLILYALQSAILFLILDPLVGDGLGGALTTGLAYSLSALIFMIIILFNLNTSH